jgi:hypothetical protein
LHRELGEAPVAIEQPELVVAEGSILADAALLASEPAAPGPTAELRLVSAQPPQDETVRTPTGLQPAVDPWPHAAPPVWAPDPAATVIRDPPARASAPPFVARPVSPAPRPAAQPRPATRPAAHTEPASRPAAQPRPATRPAAHTEPASRPAAQPRPPTRPAAQARAATAPTRRWDESELPGAAARARPDKAKRPPKKRRRGRFVRFLQILLSIAVLVAVPLVAMVLAYGYGNGEPIEDDITAVVEDVARLVGLSLR